MSLIQLAVLRSVDEAKSPPAERSPTAVTINDAEIETLRGGASENGQYAVVRMADGRDLVVNETLAEILGKTSALVQVPVLPNDNELQKAKENRPNVAPLHVGRACIKEVTDVPGHPDGCVVHMRGGKVFPVNESQTELTARL